MNKTVIEFTRKQIKEGLVGLPDSWQMLFKRMYSHTNLELPINEVVDNMPVSKLDFALTQVEKSIQKLNDKSEINS